MSDDVQPFVHMKIRLMTEGGHALDVTAEEGEFTVECNKDGYACIKQQDAVTLARWILFCADQRDLNINIC